MEEKYTVADAILDTLKKLGINDIFGYPGGAVIPFYDRLAYHKDMKHYLVRNEQGSAFASQGSARTNKGIGVSVATSGPGVANTLTAVGDAYLDSVPMLLITGQVVSSMIGLDAFQELDSIGLTMPITKQNYLVTKPDDVVKTIVEAVYVSTHGRPGPVHIDFPKDIFLASHPKDFDIPEVSEHIVKKYSTVNIDNSIIDNFLELIENSKRPILLVGQGVKHSGGEKLLNKFIEILGIPTVTTLLAKGTVNSSEYYMGMLGMHGFYHANHAVHNADLIINIGSRFDDRIVGNYESFGKNAKIIHVDIDRSELNKLVKTDLPVHNDAKSFLNSILESGKLKKLNISAWIDNINDWKKSKPYFRDNMFSMKTVLSIINEKIKENRDQYIFVTDVGQHQMVSAQVLDFNNSGQWLSSGGSGSMGFALPTAMGAAAANPDKTIVCIVGDGSFQMNIQELMTIKDYGWNIKILVLNNNFLGMVRQWQELFHDKNYSSTPITTPDIELLAKAYGLDGKSILSIPEIDQWFEKIFFSKGPFLAEFKVETEENVFPMVAPGKSLDSTITE